MKQAARLLKLLPLIVFALACFAAGPAKADCANPAGVDGDIFYNSDYNVPQYCNGTEWGAFGALNPAAGGGGCPSGGNEGDMIYNATLHVYQFCDGDDWQAVGGVCRYAPPTGSGYFVLSHNTYNGNLGGQSGADASCLSDLTTNTTWLG